MPETSTNFPAAIRLLAEAGVRYVLIGGLAMIARGASHVTTDIDICYDRANISALTSMLVHHKARLRGVPPDLPFVLNERTFRNSFNLTLEADFGPIDLLALPDGIDSFDGLWDRSDEMEIFGVPVRVASISDLISMKRAAGRTKDAAHILELQDLQRMLAEDEP